MMFFRLTGLAIAASIALVGSAAAQKIQLRFSTAAPPPDFLSKSLERFKEEAEKAAPDQFDIKLHPGSSLFRQGTEVPAIQRGNLEMSTMTTFEVAQQIPEWGFFNRAFLFRDWDHVAKVMRGRSASATRRTSPTRWESSFWRPPISARASSTCAPSAT